MMDEFSAEWLQSMGLLCGEGPGLTTFKSGVLIFRCNRHLTDDNFKKLRNDIVQQVKEGVVVLPSYVQVINPSDEERRDTKKEKNKMYKCPYCGSRRVFRYICDCDWGGGENYFPLNPVDGTNIYSKSDLDDPVPPDIDICHCRNCDMFFDPVKSEFCPPNSERRK